MNFEDRGELINELGTPFYLFDTERFEDNVANIKRAFNERYDKVIVAYSFKTNYIPALTGEAIGSNCYAEVVSGMEYEMAEFLGFPGHQIIFNGPIKKQSELWRAIENRSIINLDSWYELESIIKLREYKPDQEVNIGLRVNIDLRDGSNRSTLQNGLDKSRFGFTREMIDAAVPLLRNHNIRINSLHGHSSSSDRAVDNYVIIAKTLLSIAEDYWLSDLEYFNVGGGFFGAAPDGWDTSGQPSYGDYAEAIIQAISSSDWFDLARPSIVIEPGASVVSNAFSIYTQVMETKTVGGKTFVIVDSSVFEIKPSMHNKNLPFYLIGADVGSRPEILVDVVGSTCMEKDIILRDVNIRQPARGDVLRLDGVGAYTMVFTPNFINYMPPIATLKKGRRSIIRPRQLISDVMRNYGRSS